jgi:hypothetical protein
MASLIPASLYTDLTAAVDQAGVESAKDKSVVLEVTSKCIAGIGRHRISNDWSPLFNNQTRNMKIPFDLVNTMLGRPLEILEPVPGQYARGVRLINKINTPSYDKMKGSRQVDVYTGKPARNSIAAGKSRDANKNNAVWRNLLPSKVVVDTDGLRDNLENGTLTTQERASVAYMVESSPGGKFPQTYTEATSGRQYADGISLQNIPRGVRRIALNSYEVDAENCHVWLMVYASTCSGFTPEVLKHYSFNTQEVRAEVADDLMVNYDVAKQVLIAALYGSVRHGELTRIMLRAGADPRLLEFSRLLMALMKDARKARKEILSHARRDGEGIINVLGKAISPDAGPLQIVAHIIQGYEAQILRAAVEGQGSVMTLEHDGWTQSDDPDLEKIQHDVKTKTGIILPFIVKSRPKSKR